ncbi:protein ANTAGONIST OF LIKE HETEROCHROMATIN PROTEIN 1-like [Tachysurus ichikawai]
MQAIINGFERKSGFPMCGGAQDGTHFSNIAPSAYHTDYHNRKGWYSVLLQGLLDSNYKFLDFDGGWPGKCHDAFVFECSYLSQNLENGSFFPKITRKINGVDIPLVIVADSAYSLNKNVMKPFPEGTAQLQRAPESGTNPCGARIWTP